MSYRVIVASLALTLVTAGQTRADDRYPSIDVSAGKHETGARKAGKPRTWRTARLHRRAAARRTASARPAAPLSRRYVQRARVTPRRVATARSGTAAHRILPDFVRPKPQVPPGPKAQPAPQTHPAPQASPAPVAPPASDPEQQAFEAAWNRIADKVNPARMLAPAAEAVGAFVAAVDEGTRALMERTVVSLARRFLVETATIGGTMLRQTPEVAIGRLHPVFAKRLAAATREARASGLPNAGCFSAYREPGLRVGGMRDKHASLHAYGLACDMAGIGPPGSDSAKLWHEIAGRHGLYNPYNFRAWRKRQIVHLPAWRHPWEWNHYQATGIRAILRHDAIRRTITARGPVDLEQMWAVGARLLDRPIPAGSRVIALGKKKARHAARWKSRAKRSAARRGGSAGG